MKSIGDQHWKALLAVAGIVSAAWLSREAAAQTSSSVDACKTQPADSTLWVPLVFDTETVLTSGSGAYAYGERGCKYFIAEINMATYSNSYFNAEANQWIAQGILYHAGAYDLPSSASFGGVIPTVEEDCKRFSQTTKVYTKLHNETSFSLRSTETFAGNWTAGICSKISKTTTGSPLTAIDPSQSGWDTYRIATRIKLRTTYQEAGVFFGEPPPQ